MCTYMASHIALHLHLIMTVMQHDIQEHDMNGLRQLAINMKSAPSVRKPVKKN